MVAVIQWDLSDVNPRIVARESPELGSILMVRTLVLTSGLKGALFGVIMTGPLSALDWLVTQFYWTSFTLHKNFCEGWKTEPTWSFHFPVEHNKMIFGLVPSRTNPTKLRTMLQEQRNISSLHHSFDLVAQEQTTCCPLLVQQSSQQWSAKNTKTKTKTKQKELQFCDAIFFA